MDKAYFLITELDVLDGSSQLLQRLSNPVLNAIVYAMVSDFQTLRNLRANFPHANFLYLDLKKSVNVNKELLSCLPELDCILNYSGGPLTDALQRVRSIQVAKTASMESEAVSVSTIHDVLKLNHNLGTVVINVQKPVIERRARTRQEAMSRLRIKEGQRRFHEENEVDVCFTPGKKFVTPPTPSAPTPQGANFQSETLPRSRPSTSQNQTQRIPFAALSPLLLQETQPLLNLNLDSDLPAQRSVLTQLLSTFFCCIYPRCFVIETQRQRSVEPAPPRFASEQQIRAHSRSEQHRILRKKLKRLLDSAEADWYRIMSRIDSDEVLAIEKLALRMKQISPLRRLMSDSSESPESDPDPGTHWKLLKGTSEPLLSSSSSGSSHDARAAEQIFRMELELKKELRAQEQEKVAIATSRGRARNRSRSLEIPVAVAGPSRMNPDKKVIFVWDANREYHERADAIRATMETERTAKEEEFYSLWVGRMMTALRANKDKSRIKYEKLYFERFRKAAPFE